MKLGLGWWRLALAFLSLLLAFVGTAKAANERRSPTAQLSDGKLAYERGEYALAVQLLVPLLYPTVELSTEEAVIDAHRVLALSYLFQNQQKEAEEEATAIFALKPSFQLDPIVDPSMAVSFFEGVRKRQESRLIELRERERKEQEARDKEAERVRRATAERIYVERTVVKHSRLVATIPFGVGQWQNGQTTKAALFLSGELLFGAASLSGYIALDQKYTRDSRTNRRFFPSEERTTAEALLGLQLGAGIAFWATMLWGIIDAHVLYKPEAVRTRELPRGPKSISLSPTVIQNGGGLGGGGLSVQGAF